MQQCVGMLLSTMKENPDMKMFYLITEKGIQMRRAQPGDDEAQLVSGNNLDVLIAELPLLGISVD